VAARGANAPARLRTAEGLDEALAGAVAHALTSVRLALIHHARRRLLADDRPGTLASDVRPHGARGRTPRTRAVRLRAGAVTAGGVRGRAAVRS
jgi:hypothetical protein